MAVQSAEEHAQRWGSTCLWLFCLDQLIIKVILRCACFGKGHIFDSRANELDGRWYLWFTHVCAFAFSGRRSSIVLAGSVVAKVSLINEPVKVAQVHVELSMDWKRKYDCEPLKGQEVRIP